MKKNGGSFYPQEVATEGGTRTRILFSTSTFPRWIGDTNPPFVYQLADRLAHRFEVHVLAPHASGLETLECMGDLVVHRYRYAPERYERLAYEGGILDRLKVNPLNYLLVPPFVLGQMAAIRRLHRQYRFSAIHAHWILPQGLAALIAGRRYGPPVLVTSHGGDLFGLRQPGMAAIKRRVLKGCAAVTVVSEAMRTEVRKLAVGVEVEVIPMGVDLKNRFVPPLAGSARDQTCVLFVGRLVEKKGVEVLVRALAGIHRLVPGIRLVIAGDGPERPNLKKLISELGLAASVKFLGALPQAELPALFQRATLVVVPSIMASGGDQEGLGLVIVEAMGCGCPVIASDLPPIRDAAQDNETARLVPPGDSEKLGAAIRNLIGDPAQRARLADAARRHVETTFDWPVIENRYGNLLEELAREYMTRSASAG